MKFRKRFLRSFQPVNNVSYFFSGESYFQELLGLINNAAEEIHLQVYIFEQDRTGAEVALALSNAAHRGVKVYLLLDGYGCNHLSQSFINQLRLHGIMVRFYSPVKLFSFKIGRRLHHKVLVVDRRTVMISGINIADRYRGTKSEPPWLDFGIRIEGILAEQAAGICFNLIRRRWKRTSRPKNSRPVLHPSKHVLLARIRQHDWIRGKRSIADGYYYAFTHAQESITMVASYFLPGKRLMRILRKAARRGVKIRLVLSEKTDAVLMKRATNYLYYWLFKNDIQIFEYQPAMVHGKVAVVDGQWVTIGSYNLNHLSEYGSVEMNADVISEEWAQAFLTDINNIIRDDCKKISHEEFFTYKGFSGRLGDRFAFIIMRFVFWLIRHLTQRGMHNR